MFMYILCGCPSVRGDRFGEIVLTVTIVMMQDRTVQMVISEMGKVPTPETSFLYLKGKGLCSNISPVLTLLRLTPLKMLPVRGAAVNMSGRAPLVIRFSLELSGGLAEKCSLIVSDIRVGAELRRGI